MSGWLSSRHIYELDMTVAGRYTLSDASQQLLGQMPGVVQILAFTRGAQQTGLRQRIGRLVERYQRQKPDIELKFIDPDQRPELVREHQISLDGELVVQYQGRQEHLQTVGEQALTNALQRLLRGGARRIEFLTGHGERAIQGQTNHGLSQWVSQLAQKGFLANALSLQDILQIPPDTSVLVVASPQLSLLSGELELIHNYVAQGGNLLWMTDPGDELRLLGLDERLGVKRIAGTVVDPAGELIGIEHPALVVSNSYPQHPLTQGLEGLTLYPMAQALDFQGSDWQASPLVLSLERSWSEQQPLVGEIHYEPETEQMGPLALALSLVRQRKDGVGEQRIVVVGDGDFLSNAYLGNGANRNLGDRIINWLSEDDRLITIPPRVADGQQLEMTQTQLIVISVGFLVGVPLLLLGCGAWVWIRRRNR